MSPQWDLRFLTFLSYEEKEGGQKGVEGAPEWNFPFLKEFPISWMNRSISVFLFYLKVNFPNKGC